MPFSNNLKRPDLKGSFSCNACEKVFCHSSSLSRHRVQAHFKTYVCMFCFQHIKSNDALRSHMLNYHQKGKLFLCKCCNWAFEDKTTLHMHTTNMNKTGHPGNVSVLARSISEGDDATDLNGLISTSPQSATDSGVSITSKSPSPSMNDILNMIPPLPNLMPQQPFGMLNPLMSMLGNFEKFQEPNKLLASLIQSTQPDPSINALSSLITGNQLSKDAMEAKPKHEPMEEIEKVENTTVVSNAPETASNFVNEIPPVLTPEKPQVSESSSTVSNASETTKNVNVLNPAQLASLIDFTLKNSGNDYIKELRKHLDSSFIAQLIENNDVPMAANPLSKSKTPSRKRSQVQNDTHTTPKAPKRDISNVTDLMEDTSRMVAIESKSPSVSLLEFLNKSIEQSSAANLTPSQNPSLLSMSNGNPALSDVINGILQVNESQSDENSSKLESIYGSNRRKSRKPQHVLAPM